MPLSFSNQISPISLGLALKNKASPSPLQPLSQAMKKPKNLLANQPTVPISTVQTMKPPTTTPAPTSASMGGGGSFGGTAALPQRYTVGANGSVTPVQSQAAAPQMNQNAPQISQPAPQMPQQTESLYSQYIKKLAGVQGDASRNVEKAREDLLKFRKSAADTNQAIFDAPTSARVMQGRAATVQQANVEKEAALSSNLESALAAQGQGLTALNQAAGFAQPQLGAYGQGFYDPVSGQMVGGGGSAAGGALNPLNNVSTLAQQVLSGQISPSQAYAMGGNVPNFQGVLNAEILRVNPQANLANLQGQYDARQANVTTAGTAPTQAFSAAYQQNYPAYLQTQAQLRNVDEMGSLLLQTAQGGTINPFAPQLLNRTIAEVRGQLSSADQARFNSTLAAFQGAASTLLSSGTGQIPTDVSKNIAAISNGSLSMGALKAMVDQAKREGDIKLQTAATLVNQPGSSIGAPRVGGSAAASGGGSYEDYLKAISS